MNSVSDWRAKLSEAWSGRRPGAALLAALVAGGAASWILRNEGEGISLERRAVSADRSGGVSLAVDSEDASGVSSWVREVLRRDANGATSEDRQLLWTFLRGCCGSENGEQSPQWFDADEALTWLRGATGVPSEVESGLTSLGGDLSLSEAIRCLALRHLGMWAEEQSLGVETVVKLRAVTGERLARGVGAAALRVLHRMRSSSGDRDWLRARVLELLEDGDCPLEQRVAALQVAVELDAAEVEPVARKLVAPGRQVVERVSAFLALGRLGNGETLQWLRMQPQPVEALVLEARERALLNLAGR
jgi:hypothetical protein